jgi:uncharacterized protein (TIGR00269 family)
MGNMKCKKCGDKASIHMRQHKLALCKAHYLEWVPAQTRRFIEHYEMFNPHERVLVAVSGGKDSLALWDVLYRLGYQADGLYIGLGIDNDQGYSSESLRYCVAFAEQHGLKLIVYDVMQEEGASIPEAARHTRRGREKPCSVCGLTKRHIMNRLALDGEYHVLATGHNLDDEAAVLFSNTLHWHVGYLQRQGPVLPSRPGFIRKVKPFFRFYERETAAYALMQDINYIYDECPYATGATSIYYKEILNRLEADRPGAKLSFYLAYLRAKDSIQFTAESKREGLLLACDSCGQPTSAPGHCAYCRTWDQVRERMQESPFPE